MSAFLQARFLTSAAKPQDFPPEAGPELAFAGRSNVGKSSAINALAGRKRLAFFSKTPGRTQTINFFDLGDRARMADLPGYGYASAPQSLRASWDVLIGGYLTGRQSLAAVVVLMDARRPLTVNDRHFLEWLRPIAARRLVLLSKSDKLTRVERAKTLASARTALDKAAMTSEVMLFSSHSTEGVVEARALLESWLKEPLLT
ncbi:MAG: YihA family ribosome biogenesis GTP-binding protein [Betaproteobacteria bacterium]|nr:YihA family ribosome biogenesis GTP-binding protein [Betaproteobacteria bacterium]